MKTLFRPLLLPFMALAVIGFILSLYIHIISLLGMPSPFGAATWSLHIGCFVIWLPAVLVSRKIMQGVPKKDFWKVALAGCPSWMKYLLYAFFGYAVINFAIFFVATGTSGKHQMGATPPPSILRGFSGHWLAFYSAGFALLYSAYHRDWNQLGKTCSKGHVLSYGDKFCAKCGEPIPDN